MPGRPKTAARRFTEKIEKPAVELFKTFMEIRERYTGRPDGSDRLSVAWRRTTVSFWKWHAALDELGNLLRERAGLPGTGPLKAFQNWFVEEYKKNEGYLDVPGDDGDQPEDDRGSATAGHDGTQESEPNTEETP